MRRFRAERGAVAVEFALVVPVLLMMVFAIVEFGIIYNSQLQVTAAVREGAREAALGASAAEVRSTVVAAASGLTPDLTAANVRVTPATCSTGADVTVSVVDYRAGSITGLFSDGVEVGATVVMRCGA
ncbi:pilus assembly protein [Salinibacterium sp. SYSU T00001]|uniref:TadE/TadG family type IV pilus assembly protein n=1 Tax=Homoserinimonas sedimenticola TaxID=2986805 RepID=UPI002236BAC5|nr:TadE/TadG family type IV pilus assembly protein [Salinibacterium sedimenticola]MCW4385432.1 pilus assembly protein [Salinibacterium sedimenticola]